MGNNHLSGERVAAYYRRSRSIQEKSIERQQADVGPHVKAKGYRVVEDCIDEDLSGDEIKKRKGMMRSIELAEAGLIEGIVMDDLDRYLRLDIIRLGQVIGPLRDAGVWLESVAQGRWDYNSMAGRLNLGITSEAKHGQLVDTAWRALTQHLRMAKDVGEPPLPPPTYGYRHVDDPDKPRKRNGTPRRKMVIEEREAEIVRFIFDWYAKGHGPTEILDELYRRSVPSPTGRPRWRRDTLRQMLDNPLYLGDQAWGKTASGKFYRQRKGEIIKGNGQSVTTRYPREDWIITPHRVPAIITDRELWQVVRIRRERSRAKYVRDKDGEILRREGEATTPVSKAGSFVLARLLVCGQCGSWMSGFTRQWGKREAAYVCARYVHMNERSCHRCEVKEQPMVGILIDAIRKLLAPEKQATLREQLRKRLEEKRSDRSIKSKRRRVADLEGMESRYAKRLVEVSEDMIPTVEGELRKCREELARARAERDEAEACNPTEDLERTLDAAMQAIWSLEKSVDGDDRLALRQALLGIVEKVVVYPERYETTTGKPRHRPGRYEITLRHGTGLEELSQMDDPRSGTGQVIQVFAVAS